MDSEWIVINAGVEVITRVEGEGGGGRDKTMFLLIRDYLLIYSVCLTLSEVTIRSILHPPPLSCLRVQISDKTDSSDP